MVFGEAVTVSRVVENRINVLNTDLKIKLKFNGLLMQFLKAYVDLSIC
jgi:hypothetical protein